MVLGTTREIFRVSYLTWRMMLMMLICKQKLKQRRSTYLYAGERESNLEVCMKF